MKINPLIREGLKYLLPAPLFWRFLAWRIGYFDPELRLLPYLCDRNKASIDVGASIGSYTSHLLTHSKTVYAFEPRPEAAKYLQERLTVRAHPRLRVEAVGLSDSTGHAQLKILRNLEGLSTIEAENTIERYGRVANLRVPTRRLDDYDGIEPVGFIKIDVEGHEGAVLRGAKRLLLRDQPSLIIEIEERHKRHSVRTVNTFLEELGYKGFFLHHDHLNPIQSFRTDEHQNISEISYDTKHTQNYVNNFVFVHSEFLEKIQHLLN